LPRAGKNSDECGILLSRGGQGDSIDNHGVIRLALLGWFSQVRSVPELAINLLEGFLDPLVDLLAFFAQMLEFPQVFHPGLVFRDNSQLLLDRLSHKLAQRNAALGSDRLSPAEEKIRDFEGGLH